MKKQKVKSCENLSYILDNNGKYSFYYDDECDKEDIYQTGFIFDCYDVISPYHVRIGRQNKDGMIKYGVICCKSYACGYIVPCVFDKIKPYAGSDLIGTKDGVEYIINEDGDVRCMDIYDIHKSYE